MKKRETKLNYCQFHNLLPQMFKQIKTLFLFHQMIRQMIKILFKLLFNSNILMNKKKWIRHIKMY